MAICFPGMASRVNLAETSAIRSAPLVMTMNWTTTMIIKTMNPTMALPPRTKVPKVSMTFPAWPPLDRISRVEEMFRARRIRVVISSMEGKMEKSSGPPMNMVVSRMVREMAMLKINIKSRMKAGKGMIIRAIIITTNSTTTFLNIFMF